MDAHAMQDYKSKKYAVLYYKNNTSVGICRKFGDQTQIFSFGGRHCGKDERALRKIGCWVLRRLDAGESEAVVEVQAKNKARS